MGTPLKPRSNGGEKGKPKVGANARAHLVDMLAVHV
jgi:hypothetical protein